MAFSKKPTIYKVRKGDTVLSVADDFSVPVERLRKWNRLKGNTLKAGRSLRIYRPVAGSADEEVATVKKSKSNHKSMLQASSKSPKTVHHTVRKGETLTSIAENYNTTVSALRRDNRQTVSHLRAGSVLVVKIGE